MTSQDDDRTKLEFLKYKYEMAMRICDPLEYIERHKQLLYAMCEYLLEPLKEKEKDDKTRLPLL